MDLKPRFDILVPGHYFCDLIFTGLPAFPALGTEIYCANVDVVPGGIMNTVIALRRLEINVGWLGMIGTDFFSRFILERATEEGVDTSLLERRADANRRVTVALSYPHDRAFVTYVDPAPSRIDLAFDALDRVEFRHLHFTGLLMDPRAPELLQECHRRGIEVSMDCQHRPETLAIPLLRQILSNVDIFMPNRGEAESITGSSSLHDAAQMLRDLIPCVVIKNGADGAFAYRGDETYFEPAIPVEPVDTTGAGDVFNAGFLAASLGGHDLQTCLHWGAFGGGRSTLGPGGATTAPTRAELDRWLQGESSI